MGPRIGQSPMGCRGAGAVSAMVAGRHDHAVGPLRRSASRGLGPDLEARHLLAVDLPGPPRDHGPGRAGRARRGRLAEDGPEEGVVLLGDWQPRRAPTPTASPPPASVRSEAADALGGGHVTTEGRPLGANAATRTSPAVDGQVVCSSNWPTGRRPDVSALDEATARRLADRLRQEPPAQPNQQVPGRKRVAPRKSARRSPSSSR